MKDRVDIDFAQARRARALMSEALDILDRLDLGLAAAHASSAITALDNILHHDGRSMPSSPFLSP